MPVQANQVPIEKASYIYILYSIKNVKKLITINKFKKELSQNNFLTKEIK